DRPSMTSTSSAYGRTASTISPIPPSSFLVGITTVTREGGKVRSKKYRKRWGSGQAIEPQTIDGRTGGLLRSVDTVADADETNRTGRVDRGREPPFPGPPVQSHLRRDVSLQLPLRDVQHLAEEEQERDDAGGDLPVLRPLVAVQVGPADRRRAHDAPG